MANFVKKTFLINIVENNIRQLFAGEPHQVKVKSLCLSVAYTHRERGRKGRVNQREGYKAAGRKYQHD